MNILYWNLKNNSNIEDILSQAILDNDVDIFLCSEFLNIDFNSMVAFLNNNYSILEGTENCEKVKVVFKKGTLLNILRLQHRYLSLRLNINNEDIILVGVHLSSNPNSDSDTRKLEIRNIMTDIESDEEMIFKGEQHSTVVIGDMNASPFDSEMINKDSFNAVLFREIINESDTIIFKNTEYERFYNPALDYISESEQSYGSFYYSSGIGSLYWYCYDQVLLRKKLIDRFVGMRYLKKVGETNLIKKVMPNKEISDHLPLLVNINI